MVRAIGGVLLGYIAMAVIIMISFPLMYIALGTEGSFAGSKPTMLWCALSLILSLGAAVVGGFICALVSKGVRAPQVLAGIILILGLLMGVIALQRPSAGAPEGEISVTEAMQSASPPAWIAFTTPFVGVIGVLIGAGLHGSPKP